VPVDHLSEHLAKVGREREISTLIKLRLIEPWPAPIYSSATHWTADYEHYVCVPMIGATITVLASGAAEL
jgi:hypothetical protein